MTRFDTLVDIIAATTPVDTIQLHITARTKSEHAGGAVGRVAHRTTFADVADLRRYAGGPEKPLVKMMAMNTATVSASEVAGEHQPPVAQHSAPQVAPARFVEHRQRARVNTPVSRSKPIR